jgi:hypothetical protein
MTWLTMLRILNLMLRKLDVLITQADLGLQSVDFRFCKVTAQSPDAAGCGSRRSASGRRCWGGRVRARSRSRRHEAPEYSAARRALAAAVKVDEVKAIHVTENQRLAWHWH